jgi:hypothetical protein
LIAVNPAVDSRRPREVNPELDMFSPRNGYNPETRSGTYSDAFLQKYMTAQGARANQLIDEALARLAKIEKGEGDYKDDEPFVVPGFSLHLNGARLDLADLRFLSKTHAPHLLLKADGTSPTQVVSLVMSPQARPQDEGLLYETTFNATVRHYLSFQALRTTADYALKENTITGVQWRSTPNSVPGNLEGISVPTLVMAATCTAHLVVSEIAYDRSAAKDKEFVGVEGANHNFQPCRPEYGDTFKRTFDYVDRWLMKPGRF